MRMLFRQVAMPIAERIGVIAGTILATHGVAQNDIQIVIAAIPVLIGILTDVATKRVFEG